MGAGEPQLDEQFLSVKSGTKHTSKYANNTVMNFQPLLNATNAKMSSHKMRDIKLFYVRVMIMLWLHVYFYFNMKRSKFILPLS